MCSILNYVYHNLKEAVLSLSATKANLKEVLRTFVTILVEVREVLKATRLET